MANVFDVARYILVKLGEEDKLPITTWKLQKLVYYSQAWSVVWDDTALFNEPIQAWANGPVCPALYAAHRGQFQIRELAENFGGNAEALDADQRETVDEVVKFYGDKSAHYLSELTHREKPWIKARGDLPAGERGNREIRLDTMAEYYGGLQ